MSVLKALSFSILAGLSVNAVAADFSFDHPGTGIGTGITPVGKLAWEQSLPNYSYSEEDSSKISTYNTDVLLRTGLAEGLELRLTWDGPVWKQTKIGKDKVSTHGLGDVTVGLKKSVDLNDDKMAMAVLAQATIATGNKEFSNDKDIYLVGSVVEYAQNDDLTTAITMMYEAQDGRWAVTAVPTLKYNIVGKWSGFSELVYRKAESKDVEYNLTSGIIYTINDRAQVDCTIGIDLNGIQKSYQSGFGFSYLF